MKVRPWAGLPDTTAMQRLASRRWPHGPHAGGVGWAAALGQLADQLAVVDGGTSGGVAGWAGLTGGALLLHTDPAVPAAAPLLVDWALQATGAAGLTVTVFVGASAGNGLLQVELYGYVLAPVAGRFRIADRLAPWGWESVGACAARAARRTPGRILAAPAGLARTVSDPLLRRHYGAVAGRAAQHGTELDAGALFDPRAQVCAEPG